MPGFHNDVDNDNKDFDNNEIQIIVSDYPIKHFTQSSNISPTPMTRSSHLSEKQVPKQKYRLHNRYFVGLKKKLSHV